MAGRDDEELAKQEYNDADKAYNDAEADLSIRITEHEEQYDNRTPPLSYGTNGYDRRVSDDYNRETSAGIYQLRQIEHESDNVARLLTARNEARAVYLDLVDQRKQREEQQQESNNSFQPR